jgi:hypothetical protein
MGWATSWATFSKTRQVTLSDCLSVRLSIGTQLFHYNAAAGIWINVI